MTKKRIGLCLLLVAGTFLLSSCGSGSETPHRGPSSSDGKIPLPQMEPDTPYPVIEERGIPIVRPDDPEQRKLYANVVRPASGEQFPVLLIATAYRREFVRILAFNSLVSSGYAVVILDVMGSGSSEGGWEALSAREIDDVAWIIDNWIPDQPWSNGKVGMYGQSYMGITSFLTAGRKPRHLKAIFPGVIHADTYRDIFFQGGIFEQQFMLFWARFTLDLSYRLPPTQLISPRSGHVLEDFLSGLKALEEHRAQEPEVLSWLTRTMDSSFFDERSPMTYWEQVADLPIMTTAGWWGIFTRGSMLNYTEIAREKQRRESEGGRAGPMRIIVGPWYHTSGAFMEGLPIERLHRRWFDWHMKADQDPDYRNYDILDPSAPVILYVLGREQWRREKEWPLSRARYETLYLSGQRQERDQNVSLNNGSLLWPGEVGEGDPVPADRATSIDYDPKQDPSRFTGQKSRSAVRWGGGEILSEPHAEDERENEEFLLTFSTAPLDRDVEVTGPAVLRLWARSDFGVPCEDPPAIWYEQGIASGIDLSPLVPWAQQQDVHWTVNLNDVFPDGRVRNITSGWLAASHRPDPARPDWTRDGYDPFLYPEDRNPDLPEAGEIYEYVIEIWPASNVFLAGHQIRIDVAVTDYPHFLPSLVPSENEIMHDEEHSSRLILPVVDAGSTDPRQWVDDPAAFFAGSGDTWTEY